MNYSTQQQFNNYQPTYQQPDLTSGLPFLNQNGVSAADHRSIASTDVRHHQQQQQQQQLNYRASNASLAGAQPQAQLNTAQYQYPVQSRPQSTYSVAHEASVYAPSSPGATSFLTMSERRMSRDSAMEGMDDPRPLAQQDFYRRADDAGSRLSQNNMSLRRGSTVSQNPMDNLRRPHIAPPIFTQQQNLAGAGYDRRSTTFSRTYPYPHPNAPEPTAGFPYAFPDPDMGDDLAAAASSSQPSLQNQQLQSIMSESTPYSRSPELRVSHKLAERKRRREMKDLFDDLRDKLPLDRTLKTSKWEILSKAVEHVGFLEDQINALRRENDEIRRGVGMASSGGVYLPS
ncbi:putative HLH transcription factor [Taphrina deformans PYCC 5710]|uniref:HLH transcription factor n=1 Tax=Taphrina deformans (strain PYCC 5710 / ATCC 11124 / CBS 356.35 / IMI 108563 / JCM 9778 / NBRC 8474) TaxID=1097556 RepID=R4XBL3_TAPDE|nr:putative HLH transcription factor [Taphrina deformans PYCC 5710]|eukprot:CCG83173.1 putative HLH transcription factor [Taphrina deformans PYCC 5710]